MQSYEIAPLDYLNYFDNLCDREKPLIWIASISKDGRPHLVPTCFVKPISENKIAVGCVFIRQTVRNLIRNQLIALGSIKFDGGYNGYMVKGLAQVMDSGEEFETLKKIILDSSKGKRTIKSMILVNVESIYSLKPGEGRKRNK